MRAYIERRCPTCGNELQIEATIAPPEPSVGISGCYIDDVSGADCRCGRTMETEEFEDEAVEQVTTYDGPDRWEDIY